MSSSGAVGLEEHLMCSICLELFTDPVCTPCEHNFCKACITKHWDCSSQCHCPLCKSSFSVRPYLRVNTLFAQIVSQVKKQQENKLEPPEPAASKPVVPMSSEVQCDVCSDPKHKALKSCLVCLSSFCETHLQPHLTVAGLKRHQLMKPVDNLEDRMCPKHQRPLELFCNTDDKTVCMMCSVLEHKNHDFLPLKDAFEKQQASLEKVVSKNKKLVKKRQQKVKEIRTAMEQSKKQAQRETDEMVKVFSEIVESVQSRLDKYSDVIEQTQLKHEKHGEELISQLEQEMSELQQRSSEAERLSRSQDPLHFLQRRPALAPPADLKDWSSVSFESASYEGTTARALSALENDLSRTRTRILDQELKRVQTFAVDVTLDPDTAHPKLNLSKDKKKVHHSDAKKKVPESTERFTENLSVLGQQKFSSGRAYFQVQVEGKSRWVVGVVKESVERKEKVTLRPSGGFWVLCLKEPGDLCALPDPEDAEAGDAKAAPDPELSLRPRRDLQKLGVFVDLVENVVSFHDAVTSELIFSFSDCDFSGNVQPYFSPGSRYVKNSAPLVIVDVGGAESETPPSERKKTMSKSDSKSDVSLN
ncbi:hypothetical protein WMY93_006782 [Mugilogobius chulae]|uniref:Uncharacterized protein n=1 Tax=Mugilogobius chulae TaxID=88201 RepID=A0AAW0PNE0_9GOBI